jgi:hypothetical protein
MRDESLLIQYDHSSKSFLLKSQSKTKKKDFFSKEKFFLCFNQQEFELLELKNRIWSTMNCECFNQSWNSFRETNSDCFKKMT